VLQCVAVGEFAGIQGEYARMTDDTAQVDQRKETVVYLASQEDRAHHDVQVGALQRNTDAGEKIAKEQIFANEHTDYISATDSNKKGAFIIQTIIDKINDFCDRTPGAGGGGGGGGHADSVPSPAAESAAVEPLLAAAQAAAEAAWRAGGDR